ncbi:hypothetical protein EDD21DRAFT_436054 [Dissophora ornata]|nr:hypothetical protein EDD21DRAFT_436054 [Dissophora ornata]
MSSVSPSASISQITGDNPSDAPKFQLREERQEKRKEDIRPKKHVVRGPNKIIALFLDQEDKDELHKVLFGQPGETLASLTAQKEAFVEQFGKTPQEVKKLPGQGWANLQEASNLARTTRHWCILFPAALPDMPKDMKEACYTNKIRVFMNVALDDVETLDHEPGEINSKSSSLRKNRDRTRQNRQAQGRKMNGLVSTKGASHELCIVEAARKEHGPNGTKALDDTLKLAKGMKDMMDSIRASLVLFTASTAP